MSVHLSMDTVRCIKELNTVRFGTSDTVHRGWTFNAVSSLLSFVLFLSNEVGGCIAKVSFKA